LGEFAPRVQRLEWGDFSCFFAFTVAALQADAAIKSAMAS
jgi:hypothetical protein